MEAIMARQTDQYSTQWIQERLRLCKKQGIPYERISQESDVNRTYISMMANHGNPMPKEKLTRLVAWLNVNFNEETLFPPEETAANTDTHEALPETKIMSGYGKPIYVDHPQEEVYEEARAAEATAPAPSPRRAASTPIALYPSTDFRKMLGWCLETYEQRRIGTITGESGTGKTTALKEFVRQTPGAKYIDCWPTMKVGDLLDAISEALGMVNNGGIHRRVMRILRALEEQPEIMLVFDEAENLRNWSVRNFDIIRKLWDHAGTPIIFAGTHELESILTRGSGRENCAYLYRRITQCKPVGITEAEAADLLSYYPVDPGAKRSLVAMALDRKHGGLGNFVEVLKICLKLADGGQIDAKVVGNAKQYKLLY